MSTKPKSRVYLVESIPHGLEDLTTGKRVRLTARVLKKLTDAAKSTIDITAMYWNLTPNPNRKDEQGFTIEQLRKQFGASEGAALYKSLQAAAKRNVKIRIIESPGFKPKGNPSAALKDDESGDLKKAYPKSVKILQIDLPKWYGSGIMHQKIWVFDNKHLYLGSANNDWKSFTQVKEMGVAVENNAKVATAMTRYFDTWWRFCSIKKPTLRHGIIDPVVHVERTLPSWSPLVPAKSRTRNPLNRKDLRAGHNWQKPMSFTANGNKGELIISGSPAELCVGGRAEDIDTLVQTIMEAEKSVCINVMDLAPVSLYRGTWDKQKQQSMIDGKPATPVWWPQLFDALLHVGTTKALDVRLLISEWAHTSDFVGPYLAALRKAAEAGAANRSMTSGCVEIRRFRIPGWQSTEVKQGEHAAGKPTPRDYPGHTRVNHTKYIVTDKRANIGTSNMTWDYFVGTAGASFNTNHKSVVSNLQASFDRDWNSKYAQKL